MRLNSKNIFWLSTAIGLLCFCMLLTSCNVTKYLPEGEELYTGYTLNIDKPTKGIITDEAFSAMTGTIQPKPNKKVLGQYAKLWFYDVTKEPPKKKKRGWKYFWKYKVGEPPVFLSQVDAQHTSRMMESRLQNFGYFASDVQYELMRADKKAHVTYTVTADSAYHISAIQFPPLNNRLNTKINETKENSLIHAGDQYNLDKLKAERERIDAYLKNEGYYFFNADYLLFKAVTDKATHTCKLTLQLKDHLPAEVTQYYRIGDIYFSPEYSFTSDSTHLQADTLRMDSLYYITYENKFRPEVLLNAVYFSKGDVYHTTDYNLTLKRLMGLGVFQYGTIKFDAVPGITNGILNTHINLTPFPRSSLRAELQGLTKSNGFTGPGINLSYRSRNVFRGAEQFVLTLDGNYEKQFSSSSAGYTSYGAGIQPQLIYPRFLLPWHVGRSNNLFIPKTTIKTGYRLDVRQGYYTQQVINAGLDYIWKETTSKQHDVGLIAVDYLNTTGTSAAFDSVLSLYPSLENSFRQQFILGTDYTYTYANQVKPEIRNPIFFRGRIDLSGNLMHLIQSSYMGFKATSATPYEILYTPYAMFGRAEADFRYYYKTGNKSRLVYRLFGGAGLPYGNSISLPFYKSFSSGGVNSLRGFDTRSLGPGSWVNPNTDSSVPLEIVGDIKLETNIEFRFPIYGYFKGALFTDAGNIWMARPDYYGDSGAFHINTFYKEIAVSSGAGIRLDADFFVIRVDVAFPVRVANGAESDRWNFNSLDFGSPTWRKNNLRINLAIGYPF